MINAVKRHIKSVVSVLSDTHLVTSLGVRMRKPIDKNGMWIGWTDVETAEHLDSVKKYTTIQSLPKEEKIVLKEGCGERAERGGCGRS